MRERDAWRRLAALAAVATLGAALLGTPGHITPAQAALAPRHTQAATVALVGAGSTFDFPFFNLAFAEYSKNHPVTVNYQPIGSGGGIKQFIANTVDFGATDVPMNRSELLQAGSVGGADPSVVQVPVALGGVALAYNLPQIGTKTLRLDSDTLSKIFLGQITSWNDAAIKRLNPSLGLPAESILPVHRSDGSGTTYIVTDYLSAVSAAWAKNVGKGKSVSWPAGLGGKGSPGVAAAVQQHPGAIGYVELSYALDNHIPFAQLKNQAGSYLLPSQATVATAASQFPNVNYAKFSIVNAPGKASYPIAGYSWVLLYRYHKDAARGKALVDLFRWLTTAGQSYAAQLKYVPLPSNVQKLATQELSAIK